MAKRKQDGPSGIVQRVTWASELTRRMRHKTLPAEGRPKPNRLINPANTREELVIPVGFDITEFNERWL